MLLVPALHVWAAPEFANEAFDRLWNEQDRAVFEDFTDRSWTWGPDNLSDGVQETFVDGEGGTRLVQYFDKSRMEINDPTADPASRFYVTNGLLPIEMMEGRIQTGLDYSQNFEVRNQARVAAIGDPGGFPTYADLAVLFDRAGSTPSDLTNEAVTALLTSDGVDVDGQGDFVNDPNTVLVDAPTQPTGYQIPRAFADYMTQTGLIFQNNQYVTGQVYDPLFVFGLPVTQAYWVNVEVGGEEVPILFQVFERRVITYNPANDPSFRVEMGNVGRHYCEWRYGADGGEVCALGGGGGGGDGGGGEDPTPEPTPEPTDYPNP
jgi:hypothetical protein